MHTASVESYMEALARGVILRDDSEAEEAMFYHLIKMLSHDQLNWCCTIISWVQKAVRPLRIKELAAAVAFGNGSMGLSDFTLKTPALIEPGIIRLLNIVLRIESGRVYMFSSDTHELLTNLTKTESDIPGARMISLFSHEKLAELCLQHVNDIVSNVCRDIYLAQTTWHKQIQAGNEQRGELNFLSYAVQHWHTHYCLSSQLYTNQKEPSPEEDLGKPLRNPAIEFDGLQGKILSFLEDQTARRRWYQLLHIKLFPDENMADEISALEIATELGLDSIVESLVSTKLADLTEHSKIDGWTSAHVLELESPLCTAIRHGHSRLVDFFLENGAKSSKAILEAAEFDRVDYLEKILEEKLQHYPDHVLKSALYKAAEAGNFEAFRFFDRASPDWDWKDDDGRTILHAAATGGDARILRRITERKECDLDAKDKEGKSALVVATQLNHTPFVEELCKMGADATLAINNGRTALHYAITRDPKIVRLLLQHKANPVALDKQSQTPLHFACRLGDSGVLIALVEALSDERSIDVRNGSNQSALHIAAACGHLEIVSFLLDHGADALSEDKEKQKPIDHAAAAGNSDVLKMLYSHLKAKLGSSKMLVFGRRLIIQSIANGQLLITGLLLEMITDVNFRIQGHSPLGVAASKGYAEIVHLLLQTGAKPDFLDGNDCSPLHGAVSGAHADTVALLLRRGANPNLSDAFGQTPLRRAASRAQYPAMAMSQKHDGSTALHMAAEYGHTEILEELLSASENLRMDIRTVDGQTPLHLAVIKSQEVTIIQELFRLGADINAIDKQGRTALYAAVCFSDIEMVLGLLKFAANPNLYTNSGSAPLHIAANSAQILDALLIHGAEVDYADNSRGLTALMHTINLQNEEGVRILLRHGASISITNKSGQTALHVSTTKRNPRITDLLLGISADVTEMDHKGLTPLHCAVLSSQDEDIDLAIVHTLLEKGASPNGKDNEGQTPLHYAVTKRSAMVMKKLVEVFCQKGLDINVKNNLQQTPLHLALSLGTYDMSRFLLDRGASLDERDKSGASCLTFAAAGEDGSPKIETILELESSRENRKTPLWDLNDKIAAFMAATTVDLGTAKFLAKSNKEIFHGQNDTFSVLNICVEYGQYDDAIEFLLLGADPFRYEDGQLSAFQSVSLTKNPKNPFLLACMKKVEDDPLDLEDQLQILALLIEHRWTDKWPLFQEWTEMLVGQPTRDYDGWTLDDLLSQKTQQRSISNAPERKTKFCTPTKLMFPRHWRETEDLKNILSLSTDGKTVFLKGELDTSVSFRADHPFPPRNMKSRAYYYFEVEIVETDVFPKYPTQIGIGICGEFAQVDSDFINEPHRTPLMSYYSNGDLYDYLLDEDEPILTDQGFSKGDIIGCGIDWNRREVYYSLDGELVGECNRMTLQYRT
ncbi:ankyrin repeat-containing domain protein [Trichoderma chlorosporum]